MSERERKIDSSILSDLSLLKLSTCQSEDDIKSLNLGLDQRYFSMPGPINLLRVILSAYYEIALQGSTLSQSFDVTTRMHPQPYIVPTPVFSNTEIGFSGTQIPYGGTPPIAIQSTGSMGSVIPTPYETSTQIFTPTSRPPFFGQNNMPPSLPQQVPLNGASAYGFRSEQCWSVPQQFFPTPMNKNYKGEFQEIYSKKTRTNPVYVTQQMIGGIGFISTVKLPNSGTAEGTGRTKKEAEMNAARQALEKLRLEN
eukprot:TRINITY_DN16670_c0_g1_i1.p1 TRINITY_DN16670_c0_g1~~TRINITY_DN16670_c0_g1_i1.p1  ORF type:complete len:272 (-),score=43.72 TRINITY_DN16670_c0_g1_i1:57-818(-)